TVLGVIWAIIQPFLLMLSFTFFFGKLAKLPSDGIPYSIFIYVAVMPWSFFANALTSSSNSLIGNANLITKVYFPRILIPAAAVAAGLVDFAIAFVLLIAFIPYYGITLTWHTLMYPVLILLTTLLALSIGILLAAVSARF